MSKRLWLLLALLVVLARPAHAQISITYSFTGGTIIDPDQVNSNFSALANNALNRTGGTLTGTINLNGQTLSGAATASGAWTFSSAGTAVAVTNNVTIGGTLAVTGALTAGGDTITAMPANIIVFTTGGSCPSGFAEYTTARGRYIVGLPASGTNLATVGTALSDQENRAVGQHTHIQDAHTHTTNVFPQTGGGATPSLSTGNAGGVEVTTDAATATNQNAGSVAGTNAPYVQLMACQKS